jgi:hypothetical protein
MMCESTLKTRDGVSLPIRFEIDSQEPRRKLPIERREMQIEVQSHRSHRHAFTSLKTMSRV